MISEKKLNDFQEEIKFRFKNKEYLLKALIHPSYIIEKNNNKLIFHNEFERLEFLGDRVLGLAVASLIFKKYKSLKEGSLTKKLSYLVKKEFLYKISLQIKLDRILKFTYKKENERMNFSILADSVESLIGGIFIDSGYISALKFIKNIWEPYLDIKESNQRDPKTKLQEISQYKFKTLPIYKLISKEGPSHSPVFTISLKALKLKLIKSSGVSIKDAEKKAALIALEIINE